MRVRVRGPGGQSVMNVQDGATVGELEAQISQSTSVTHFDLKYGYPPKPLLLGQYPPSTKLAELGIQLDGEQLIVSRRSDEAGADAGAGQAATGPSVPSAKAPAPLPPALEPAATDAPELPLASHAATLTLRIMPDDNSCLFRALDSAILGATDNMRELRSIVAQTIRQQPETYSAAVLDRAPDDYCRWIQGADAWGGAIELAILGAHFDVEVCSVDVQTLRVDRFNAGRPTRCLLVYSGIHYDVIALSPGEPPFERATAPPEFDVKLFDARDDAVLEAAVELCRVLRGRHYYTDTAAFSVRCNVCRGLFTGEKGATEHARQTGHYDFGEAG